MKYFRQRRYRQGFFPGGPGLFDPGRNSVSTLVLGSDFGNLAYYNRTIDRGDETNEPTWRRLKPTLGAAGFDLVDCFYTNAWPVLRLEGKQSGDHSMRHDAEFTKRCELFFQATLEEMNPKLIIPLGIAPAWFVGRHFGGKWKTGEIADCRLVHSAELDSPPIWHVGGRYFFAATHPSQPQNIKHRAHGTSADVKTAIAREIAMLRTVRGLAGIADAGLGAVV